MNSVFTIKRIVEPSEIDALNHVNNVVYVKWMEQVATAHWYELTKNNPMTDYVWVVAKHEIDYFKQALLGDEITMKTWVGKTKGFKSERHIEFYKNKRLLVKAKTIWAMLDAKTFKPTRITENVLKVLQT